MEDPNAKWSGKIPAPANIDQDFVFGNWPEKLGLTDIELRSAIEAISRDCGGDGVVEGPRFRALKTAAECHTKAIEVRVLADQTSDPAAKAAWTVSATQWDGLARMALQQEAFERAAPRRIP